MGEDEDQEQGMIAACYALYKGDKFIDLGSRSYLAKLLGVKEATITFYMSPSHAKKVKRGNSYIVIRLED